MPYNKHLINQAKLVCMGKSWPRLCVQTSQVVLFVSFAFGLYLQTSVKILPYRPPARLIRAKYKSNWILWKFHVTSLCAIQETCGINHKMFQLTYTRHMHPANVSAVSDLLCHQCHDSLTWKGDYKGVLAFFLVCKFTWSDASECTLFAGSDKLSITHLLALVLKGIQPWPLMVALLWKGTSLIFLLSYFQSHYCQWSVSLSALDLS